MHRTAFAQNSKNLSHHTDCNFNGGVGADIKTHRCEHTTALLLTQAALHQLIEHTLHFVAASDHSNVADPITFQCRREGVPVNLVVPTYDHERFVVLPGP